jgi:CHAD domain-containing protein
MKGMAEPALVDGVRAAAVARARAHHVAAAAAVGSPRYTRLMLGIARWVHTMGWHEDAAASEKTGKRLAQPVTQFARQILLRDQRRLRKRARNLRAAAPEARHRVRIAAKKSRYAVEFFGSLFKPRPVGPYVKGLTGLQDALGLLNDAAVADRLLAEVAAAQPQLEAGAGFARGFLAAQVESGGKKIVKLWKKFAPIPLPR